MTHNNTIIKNTAVSTLAAIALFASVAGVASADRGRGSDDVGFDDRGKHKGWIINGDKGVFADKRDKETGIEIKRDGKIEVRGAKVTAVSSSQITASTTLGTVNLTVTANIDPNTKVESKNGKPLPITDVAVGDMVTLKGMMTSGNSLTFTATLVRDVSKSLTPAVTDSRQVFEGKISVLPGATLPTTLTITIGSTPQVINITNTTTLLNAAWAPVSLATFQLGDSVRVFGFIPTGSTTVNGLVVRNVTR